MYRYNNKLHKLLNLSENHRCNKGSRYIIFSDFHLGRGGKRDDFYYNGAVMIPLLRDYYFPAGFHLVLNGDIEELQKNKISAIENAWADLYDTFELFQKDGRLTKIIGNHDLSLLKNPGKCSANSDLQEGLVLSYENDRIFIFHGHQASHYNGHLNSSIGYVLRYLAHPLGIKNIVRDYGNLRIHRTEQRVYAFSQDEGIISCIGHTHRPLFESLSNIDILMYNIEYLLRAYETASRRKRKKIEEEIAFYKNQLHKISEQDPISGSIRSIYNKDLIIPVIFNSGCVIGKKYITGLEISEGTISLVRWSSGRQLKKYGFCDEAEEILVNRSKLYRKVLKSDSLSYIFSRIKLLS